ncbi:MAG: amino acid permease [Bacillales bacterium]|jgi:amino acid transporter|nr:amino acid permease [Bacillales bacterium]
MSSLKRLLIGRPMKSDELGEQKLTKLKGLAILSSDALSSIAYGTEQILIVLATVGVASFWYNIPIAIGILVLLFALILSYRQIIFAYPNGGGAYMVSKENIGVNYGLVAGGSLLVDYILTVAVSVAAGTDAFTSAFPSLHDHNVMIAVIFVVIITILNLRGLTESASILMYPVYLFVLCIFVMLAVGIFKVMTGDIPATLHPEFGAPVTGITLFILMKAFASGTSALTGVEAISNAIPTFKDPAPKNAAKTLVIMGSLLAVLFVGITFLSFYYGVAPKEKETIVSQIASVTFGRGFMYYLIQGTTTAILVLAANTGFSAFPQLAFNLAKDGFIPRKFTVRGDRLGYSNGIIVLGVSSILLIFLFKGKTEQLIPLYAVGVFIPFTLSQTGMIFKWFKERSKGWIPKMLSNLLGAVISFTVLAIFFITKFEKVWFVLIFLPAIVYLFHQIKKHYDSVAVQLRVNPEERITPYEGNVIVVPVAGITKVVEKSVNYAKSITDQVYAVYVAFDREEEKRFVEKWNKWYPDVRLVTLQSKYRGLVTPLMKFISTIENKAEDNKYQVTVLIPQFVTKKAWHHFLHNQSSLLIRAYLIFKKDVVVTTVPYHFDE